MLINLIIINIVKFNGIEYILSMYCVAMFFEINLVHLKERVNTNRNSCTHTPVFILTKVKMQHRVNKT